jgi:hypothetical protein
MKGKIIRIFWGMFLISLGGLSIADKLGYISFDLITKQAWAIIFAVISAAFFLSYILSGIRQWGWLFPTLIFAALALTISTILVDNDNPIIALPILLSIAIPFFVGFLVNRKQWGLLIPAWILTVCAAIPALSELSHEDLIGALFLFAIALPFLVVYLVDKRRKWALISAVVLAFIGTFPLVNFFIHGDIQGPIVMFLFTLFFLVTYFLAKRNWWALIPAGVFASIGLVALLDMLLPSHDYISIGDYQIGVYSSVLFLGFAITFGVLWLLRASQPTGWAKYPAIGLLVIALLAFLMGKSFEDFLPAVALLIIGVIMVSAAFLKKRVTNQHTS